MSISGWDELDLGRHLATWLAHSSDATHYKGGDDVRLPGVHVTWFPKATGQFKAAMTQKIWGR